MQLNNAVADAIVSKTKGASAAFIKELMRRSAQFALLEGKDTTLRLNSVDAALEEMVFIGGSLNLKLLGAADGLDVNSRGQGGLWVLISVRLQNDRRARKRKRCATTLCQSGEWPKAFLGTQH